MEADRNFHMFYCVDWNFYCWTTYGRIFCLQGRFVVKSYYFKAVKFIYSEKTTKFCEISTLFLSVCKEIGDEEPDYSTKISIFSFIWAGLAAFHKASTI